jgi:hypothetical protein
MRASRWIIVGLVAGAIILALLAGYRQNRVVTGPARGDEDRARQERAATNSARDDDRVRQERQRLATSPLPKDSVKVRISMYSGRPDPEWELSPQQAAELRARLDALPTATGTQPRPPWPSAEFSIEETVGGQVRQRQIAFRGTIGADSDEPRVYRVDPTRSVERYLLQTGRSHLLASERALMEERLANP